MLMFSNKSARERERKTRTHTHIHELYNRNSPWAVYFIAILKNDKNVQRVQWPVDHIPLHVEFDACGWEIPAQICKIHRPTRSFKKLVSQAYTGNCLLMLVLRSVENCHLFADPQVEVPTSFHQCF